MYLKYIEYYLDNLGIMYRIRIIILVNKLIKKFQVFL